MCLNKKENVVSVSVIPGRPILRMAFKLLLQDERMKEQTARVEKSMRKKELKDERKDVFEDIDRLLIRKRDLVEEQRKLLENAEQFERTFGVDELNKQKAFLPLRLHKVQEELENLETRLEVIRNELDNL